MADNKLLLKREPNEDFLSEEDPLAELARIAAFDPPSTARTAVSQRREPVFDLEDELLKELEIYAHPAPAKPVAASAPREPEFGTADPAPAASVPAVEAEPEYEAEVASEEADRSPAPVLDLVETYADASAGRVYERPASHPVFDLEDEIMREFAAFDARRSTPHKDHPVEAEVIRQDPASLAAIPSDMADLPALPQAEMRVEGRRVYESFLGDDLDAAISRAASPAPEPADEPYGAAFEAPDATPGRDDLNAVHADAGWNTPEISRDSEGDDYWSQLDAEAASDGSAPEEHIADPAASDEDGAHDLNAFAVPFAAQGQPHLAQGESAVADRPDRIVAEQALPVEDVDQALRWQANDGRVGAGIEFDLPQTPEAARAASHETNGEATPSWGLQPQPAHVEALHEPSPSEAVAADSGHDERDLSFDDHQLEIDLGEIELDLSDFEEAEFSVSRDAATEESGSVTRTATVAEAPLPPAQTDYSSLPFDPSQITAEEQNLETIAELDVPDVHVPQEEAVPAPHPEYDIDLDAEMAQLFAAATAPASGGQNAGDAADPADRQGGGQARAGLDLDEFERALEEDFRRSFSENRTGPKPDRVALAPADAQLPPSRSRRGSLLLAGAAMAIVLFGGAGVFAFMSGDTKLLASSEPKVILADTEPVKVVPEDPGGKQVPNQNKAVYDRVAGENTAETRQETLLTSNEEPVDVVQRTLEPENLPMEEDAMAAATPTGDTVDPRLLPDEAEQERVATTSKVVSGVSPRKVKTMVVRPDGSLVEREVTEEDLKQQAANDAELMKIAQQAARDAATASESQADDIAKTIESVPERLAPAEETAAAPADAADAKTARVTELTASMPVEPDAAESATTADADAAQPPAVNDAAVTARIEAAPPAVVEGQDNPVDLAPAQADSLERAVAVANPEPVDDNTVATVPDAEGADAPVRKVRTTTIAPVPDVRPVDQPTTVVGTVTDQGTVRADVEAKPQEVAIADQATQSPVETTPVPAGTYVIQIASLPSEAEAQTSYTRLSSKFAGIIGGRGVDIRKAEIKNKGTYYRVRIPAGSKQEAQALCAQYKKAGGSCLVSR